HMKADLKVYSKSYKSSACPAVWSQRAGRKLPERELSPSLPAATPPFGWHHGTKSSCPPKNPPLAAEVCRFIHVKVTLDDTASERRVLPHVAKKLQCAREI